mgnify:CR=1 FL=1
MEAQNGDPSKLKIATQLQNTKQMNLDSFIEANSNSKAADVILVPVNGKANGRKKSNGKRRKMNMDSDE